MALLKFISLSVGSLMLFQGAYASESKTSEPAQSATTGTKTAGAVADPTCVTTMNAARQQVSLPDFGTPSNPAFTNSTSTTTLNAICSMVQPKNTTASDSAAAGLGVNGTAAYQLQEAENCAEAVTSWKAGFAAYSSYNKSSPPPAFTASNTSAGSQLGDAPYNTVAAINFAALFNAKDNASAECAFVTCPDTANAVAANATVCITYPAALSAGGGEPWTKDQWKKIWDYFSSASSASAAVPTLLALVAVAAGVAVM